MVASSGARSLGLFRPVGRTSSFSKRFQNGEARFRGGFAVQFEGMVTDTSLESALWMLLESTAVT